MCVFGGSGNRLLLQNRGVSVVVVRERLNYILGGDNNTFVVAA